MSKMQKIRKQKKISQYELGKATGLYQSKIWQIEKGYYQPKEEEKESIAKALGVGIDDLFPT